MRNKETENRVLNSLCSDQRRFQTEESQSIFIGLLPPTDNLTMSKNIPLDPRPSSITNAPRLKMYWHATGLRVDGDVTYTSNSE